MSTGDAPGGVMPEPPVGALRWESGALLLLDQTLLPGEEVWNARETLEEVEADIRRLAVRGAPAIGVAAAYGLVLAARALAERYPGPVAFDAKLRQAAARLSEVRPTAVNLRVAVDRSLRRLDAVTPPPAGAAACLLEAARELETYERDACAAIARAGAELLRGRERIVTHCNAGALVTPGLGTALAPLYLLHAQGAPLHVWVDETRPLLQGLRLTAYELGRAGIPYAVVGEGAVAGLFRLGRVDAVITGADRVCRNGDVINKVGTYGLAVFCRQHEVPFYVAAPLSTLDPATPDGAAVPIEQRAGDGLRYLSEGIAAPGTPTWEPAFDVTPAALVTALISDRGVLAGPDTRGLEPWMKAAVRLQGAEGPGR